jgi:hypothetical protein
MENWNKGIIALRSEEVSEVDEPQESEGSTRIPPTEYLGTSAKDTVPKSTSGMTTEMTTEMTSGITTTMEDVKDCDDSSIVDATHVLHNMILQEELREKIARRSHQCTTSLADLKLETQPADVFQRMWTLVDEANPIWRNYRALVNLHTTGVGQGRRQASACGNCMTIFHPKFPDSFHLHQKSKSFKTAIDKRVVNSNREAVVAADGDKEMELHESTAYKALTGLAKEAKAYKKETDMNGIPREYIKMVRFVKGIRMAASGGAKYPEVELCERCEVEDDIQEAANQKYKVKALGDGIMQLISR